MHHASSSRKQVALPKEAADARLPLQDPGGLPGRLQQPEHDDDPAAARESRREAVRRFPFHHALRPRHHMR